MKHWLDHWYNKYAVMALTAALCLGGYEAINWNGLSASDWGTWVGAVGTVATLAMTIWLATDASRTKRDEQLNLALITAAHFKVRLRNVVRALASARVALETPLDQPDDPRSMFGESFRRFDDNDLWAAEELVPLVYLPNQLAARLAWIGIDVRSTQVLFKKLSEEAEPKSWDVMEFLARTIVYDLKRSLAEIQRVMVELTNFQLEHDFEFAVPRYNPTYEANRN
jgi:hypothetical protein